MTSYDGPTVYIHTYDPDGVLLEARKKPKHMSGQFGWAYETMELFLALSLS